jgi:hypothetical protein
MTEKGLQKERKKSDRSEINERKMSERGQGKEEER